MPRKKPVDPPKGTEGEQLEELFGLLLSRHIEMLKSDKAPSAAALIAASRFAEGDLAQAKLRQHQAAKKAADQAHTRATSPLAYALPTFAPDEFDDPAFTRKDTSTAAPETAGEAPRVGRYGDPAGDH
jgi:hypothetical protein